MIDDYEECDCDDCKPKLGPQGNMGYQGIIEIGVQGSRGPQMSAFQHFGFQGDIGLQGSDVQGDTGWQGYVGDDAIGDIGMMGNQGVAGRGVIGSQGTPGLKGPQGIATLGPQGLHGQNGTEGAQGDNGAQGNSLDATGMQGLVGAPIIFPPVSGRGTYAYTGTNNWETFSSLTLPRGLYVDIMTVSVTSLVACTGKVRSDNVYPFSISDPSGATITMTMQHPHFLPYMSNIVSWLVNATQPVTITWTLFMHRSN